MDDEDEKEPTIHLIQGRKARKKKTPKPKKDGLVKEFGDFLNTPIYDLTVGDHLVMGACATIISITITVAVQASIQTAIMIAKEMRKR